MGLLDFLTGNNAANLPYGMLYQQPGNPAADPQTALDAAGLGIPQSAVVPSPFGDPSKLSVAAPSSFDVPKPNDIWSNAAPFSLAGGGPAMQWPPAPPADAAAAPASPAAPAPAAPAPAPQPPATDLSSVNRPAPAAQPDRAAPIAIGNYQMPRIGEADDFEPDDDADELPANAKPTSMTGSPGAPAVPAAPTAAASPAPFSLAGASDRLGLAGRGFLGNMAAGPIGALAGGLGALITGKPTDAASIANQKQNLTAQALIAKRVPVADVQAAVGNPDIMKTLVTQYFGPDKFQHVTRKDAFGGETAGTFDPTTGKYTWDNGNAGTGGGGSMGLLAPGVTYDPNKTGPDYLAQFSPEVQAAAKAWLNGDTMPTGNARMQSIASMGKTVGLKYAQDMGIPANDTIYAQKRKMQTDIASSGNSSMGGILANGKSAFEHLREVSDGFAKLGNASHDFLGGGPIASAQNYVGNVLVPSSGTAAKLTALDTSLGHYGQESTKFYAGTGGGESEREAARRDTNPRTTSSEQQAAYLETERNLMTDRLQEKERQIRDVMGDAYLQRHPVFTPELQQTMGTIDANIAKLRGQAAPTAVSAPAAVPAGNYVWTPNGGLVGAK